MPHPCRLRRLSQRALGGNTFNVVTMALEAGFRKFDTAEADWWYDQATVGRSVEDFFTKKNLGCHGLEISTKIPPWSLTSASDIRAHASNSRNELVGFCGQVPFVDSRSGVTTSLPFPLDVYYM
jgi:diketogulonate reductase-like aldo/keto reductase